MFFMTSKRTPCWLIAQGTGMNDRSETHQICFHLALHLKKQAQWALPKWCITICSYARCKTHSIRFFLLVYQLIKERDRPIPLQSFRNTTPQQQSEKVQSCGKIQKLTATCLALLDHPVSSNKWQSAIGFQAAVATAIHALPVAVNIATTTFFCRKISLQWIWKIFQPY